MSKDRIESIMNSHTEHLEKMADEYPDVKILLDSYKKLLTQNRWSKDFLDGYLSCISDLTFVKRLK